MSAGPIHFANPRASRAPPRRARHRARSARQARSHAARRRFSRAFFEPADFVECLPTQPGNVHGRLTRPELRCQQQERAGRLHQRIRADSEHGRDWITRRLMRWRSQGTSQRTCPSCLARPHQDVAARHGQRNGTGRRGPSCQASQKRMAQNSIFNPGKLSGTKMPIPAECLTCSHNSWLWSSSK